MAARRSSGKGERVPRDVLAEIVERKTREIAEAKRTRGLDSVRREAEASPAPRGFVEALLDRSRRVG
jgi:indole-3-glycerol phosphate synthase